MMNLDIFVLKNSVDQDQLVKEKRSQSAIPALPSAEFRVPMCCKLYRSTTAIMNGFKH